jgi:hypothetical protein
MRTLSAVPIATYTVTSATLVCGPLIMSPLRMGKIFVALLALVACSKDAPTKMKAVDIPTTGFVVDIPEDWSLEMRDMFAKLIGGRPGLAPIVEIAPFAARTPDELADAKCKDGTDIKKETLPSGAAFVTCRRPSRIVQGDVVSEYAVEVAVDADRSIHCFGSDSTDEIAKLPIQICTSIRPK